jgi:hypothetical protein
MDQYRYYRSILSVMLATDCIDLSVKIFSFFTNSIDHRSEKKNFSPIKSNHRLKIFFSSKDHRSNRCFLQLIDYRYRSNRCFFRHRCPPMLNNQDYTRYFQFPHTEQVVTYGTLPAVSILL